MGCVHSLFNPAKSSTSSPEKEFVPPTFETVVVKQQPSKTTDGNVTVERSADDGESNIITTNCDNFEKYAYDENDDRHSIHYVEATAVRTLAANTGSVAILGTTAKCKSVDNSPGVHQPLAERQKTWSPSSPSGTNKPLPQVETRYVEATAVRTLAADTGSIAILGTTADPKPQSQKKTESKEETGSIHYVEATAVRQLAAETGSIAILASTVVPQKISNDDQVDFDDIPMGVREVLDSEPGQLQQQENAEADVDDTSNIPLPVIYAMEMKSGVRDSEEIANNMTQSSSFEKNSFSQQSTTTDSTVSENHAGQTSLSRKPLVRQSNANINRDQQEIDNDTSSIVPNLNTPIFAKCVPIKSNSLPSGNLVSDVSTEELKGNGQLQGVIRGLSLPCDRNEHVVDRLQLDGTGGKNEKEIADPTKVKSKVVFEDTEEKVTKTRDETAVAGDVGTVSPGTSVDGDKAEKLSTGIDGDVAGKRNGENVPRDGTGPVGKSLDRDEPSLNVSDGVHANDEKTSPPVGDEKTRTAEIDKTPSPDNADTPISDSGKISLPGAVPMSTSEDGMESSDDVKTPVSDDGKTISADNQNNITPVSDADDGSADADADADAEYRLTMIQSVREAVNRICEQAVEQTAAIVKSGRGRSFLTTSVSRYYKRDPDDSEAADYESSEFSLPPPPQSSRPSLQPHASVDTVSVGQETSWPPPPPHSDAEDEERTIALGFSFDLPDPPTEMDQMDLEADKLDISDEEMRATGLPSDDDDDDEGDKTKTKIGAEEDSGNAVMKSVTDNDGTSLASAGEGTTDDSGSNNKATDPTTNVTTVNDGADDRAATTIQAVYRGFRARKYVETVNAAAVKIQAGFRGYRVRRSLKNSDPPTIELSAPTDADENNDWSDDDDDDDDEKSVVSVTYAPLKERDQQQQVTVSGDGDPSQTADGETIESKGSDAKNPIPSDPEGRSETEEKKVEDGDDVEEDAEALTNAAVKIQAMVRGQAARKRLNDENNTEKQ